MPDTPYEYRLRIRNRDDDGDLLVLSSRAGDANCLLSLEPNSDGQRVDVFLGTQELGVVVWQAIDRDDGDDFRTITALIADDDARNQMLSNRCVGEYATDGGSWEAFHTGFLNEMSLPNALEFSFTVGDTDRREQDAELFKFLTPTFNRGSYLIGGPIPARTPSTFGETKYSFGARPDGSGGVSDFGPVRFQKVPVTIDSTNVVGFEIAGGVLRPYYRAPSGTVREAVQQRMDAVDTINRLARTWAVGTRDFGDAGRIARAWFPGLVARLRRVSDGATFDRQPVAVPVASHLADTEKLINGFNVGLYLYWPAVQPQPSDGEQFDIIIFPNEVSENAPLHWAGHPVDLATLAMTQEGIAYEAAAAAAVKAALPSLWVEYVFTGPVPLTKLRSDYVYGPFGIAGRTGANGEHVMKLVRDVVPASVATITTAALYTEA